MNEAEQKRIIKNNKQRVYDAEHSEERTKYRTANKANKAKYDAEYKKKNAAYKAAIQAKRRATKLCQTPLDADFKLIEELYKEARALSESTGIPHHVDHIKPLDKGGYHHQDNLQVLTAEENIRKSNKY